MKFPLEVHGPEVNASEALLHHIEEHVAELGERYPGTVQRGRVAVDRPHRHAHKGAGWTVKVELSVSGHPELVATAAGDRPGEDPEDAYLTITHAFSAVARQLERLAESRRDRARRPQSV